MHFVGLVAKIDIHIAEFFSYFFSSLLFILHADGAIQVVLLNKWQQESMLP